MITIGSRTALNTVTGSRRVCLKLRRSMTAESVSHATTIGAGPVAALSRP
jgi:hypothetical protein